MIRTIHQTARTALTPEEESRKKQTQSLMPEWEYTFWSDKALRTLAEQGFPHVLEVWDSLIGIQRADIGRYMVLATHGGLYMDTDFVVRRAPGRVRAPPVRPAPLRPALHPPELGRPLRRRLCRRLWGVGGGG